MNNSKPTTNNEATEETHNVQYTPSTTTIEEDNSIEDWESEFPPIRQLNENQVSSADRPDSDQDDMHPAAYDDHIVTEN